MSAAAVPPSQSRSALADPGPSSSKSPYSVVIVADEKSRYPEPSRPTNDGQTYPGSGTPDDPYIINWDLNDPENPYSWSKHRKWLITTQLALCTWTVSFSSSSYSGGISFAMRDLHISESVAVLGVSLYVLGFGFGPLLFAPMGETFGRRIVFLTTFSAYTLSHLGGSLGHNVATLLSCRLLSGILGSSPLTNAGGAISDIWNARERGLASAIYATAPFLGPVIGPIVGGFVAQNTRLGWRFNFWLMFIFSTFTLIFGYLVTPETYAPVLLRRRALKLQADSGGLVYYTSIHDIKRSKSFAQVLRKSLGRPLLFMFTEPIVTCLAVYISIVYGTLYALFSAYPIVFQQHRGFSPGEGGLAFLGVGLGIITGTSLTPVQNRIYWRAMDASETGRAPPEARLHMSIVGGVVIPIGLFWFAWTSEPPVPWIVPIIAGMPFGTGVAQILQGLTAYMMDTYGIYTASALAATILLRSIFAAVFPLVCPIMFARLGDQWGMSVFAFCALACMPLPALFWKHGAWIRSKSAYAFNESKQAPAVAPTSASCTRVNSIKEKGGEAIQKDNDLERAYDDESGVRNP